jgi:PAS domain-containing protein
MNSSTAAADWVQRTSASDPSHAQDVSVFESLFERTTDAIWLYDPQTAILVDCNRAAVQLIGARNKQQLLRTVPADISPAFQPDGRRSDEKAEEIISAVEREKSH